MSRPTKYDKKYNEQVYKLCLLGATDAEIANFFEVDEATVYRWKKEYPEFCDSIKRGKDIADSNVASKLYHRATGYQHQEIITASFQGTITDTMEVTKHYAPDPTAAIFWLKNRQPKKWRDKQEIDTKITGDLTTTSISIDAEKLKGLTDAELAELKKLTSKMK